MGGLVSVFRRQGRYVLSVSAKDPDGIWNEFLVEDLGEAPGVEVIGARVREGLARSAATRAEASRSRAPDEGLLPGLVGVRSYAVFAKTAHGARVRERDGTVRVMPLRRERRGYFTAREDDARVLPLDGTSDAVLGQAVENALYVAADADRSEQG